MSSSDASEGCGPGPAFVAPRARPGKRRSAHAPPLHRAADPADSPPAALRRRRRLGQVLGQPIDHPSAWYADDMRRRQHEWVYTLSEQDVAELEAATAAAAATGKPVEVRPRLCAHGRGATWLAGWRCCL